MLTTNIHGTEYSLNSTLRVAYEIQGLNGHKPYLEIFQGIDKMLIEKQIEILYVAFKLDNPEVAKTMPFQMFLSYYLENFTLKQVMDQLSQIVKAIMGEDEGEYPNPAPSEGASGN